jgi:hypothetical protein
LVNLFGRFEDGNENFINDRGEQAPAFVEESSFRLKSLADLRKCRVIFI